MQIDFTGTGSDGSSIGGQFRARLVAFGGWVVAALRYIFFFEWVVDVARWLVTTGGNVAESAFLLATVYVTINTVAHQLILWVLPSSAIVTMNQISVIAFSVLPELIIFAAIKVTFDHFKMAFATKRLDSWVWAILYVLPTVVFLLLTVYTISSFVSVEATTANAPQATGGMLVTRCLAGWSYGMLQMLWAKLGHEGYSNLFASLRSEIADLVAVVAARDGFIAGLEQDKAGLLGQVAILTSALAARDAAIADLQVQFEEQKKQHINALAAVRSSLQAEIETLQSQGSNAGYLLKLRDGRIANLQAEIDDLKEQNATLDSELIEARIALARRPGSASNDESEESISEVVMSSEKYQKVKMLMQHAIASGQKINMKKISADTGISYNTIRRYAQSILDSLVDRKAS